MRAKGIPCSQVAACRSDGLSHLCDALLLTHDPSKTWVLMAKEFTGSFDDSGHPVDDEVVLVAGFLGTQEQWNLAGDEWRIALARKDIKSGFFHMTDFESGKHKDYAHLSESDRCSLLRELVGVVRTRARYSFCFVVPMADYRTVNADFAVQECLGAPYAVAGRVAAAALNEWQAQHNREQLPLLIIFEDGTKHKGDFMDVMRRDGLPCPAFGNKKLLPPLQAADMLAWEAYRAYKTHEVRSSFSDLLHIPHEHGVFAADDMVRTCEMGNVVRRKDMLPGDQIVFHSALKKPRKQTIW